MSNEDHWITVPRFFEIGYDYRQDVAELVWEDLDKNTPKWHGWTSRSPNYSYEQVNELVEIFINHHSAIDVEGNRVYTQMPAGTFFYASPGTETNAFFVRGAVWSNGAFWEEIPLGAPRQMSLSMDDTTMKAFDYVSPDFDQDSSISKLIKSWENDNVENNDANNDNAETDNPPPNQT